MMDGLLIDHTAILLPRPMPSILVIGLIPAPAQTDRRSHDLAETALRQRALQTSDGWIESILKSDAVHQVFRPRQFIQCTRLFREHGDRLLYQHVQATLESTPR